MVANQTYTSANAYNTSIHLHFRDDPEFTRRPSAIADGRHLIDTVAEQALFRARLPAA